MAINNLSGDISWNPGSSGESTFTVVATDLAGESSSQEVTVTVIANSPPVIGSEAIEQAALGEQYIYDVDATDPDSDDITYRLVDSAEGMEINPMTGLIKWTPTQSDVGNHQVLVEADDLISGVDQQSYTIAVIESEVCGEITTGGRPSALSLSIDGTTLLSIDNAVQASNTFGNLYLMDTVTEELLDTIPLNIGFPSDVLAISDQKAFVSISKAGGSTSTSGVNSIEVVDLVSRSVVASIELGGASPYGPVRMVYNEDSRKLYVSDRGNNRVIVVDVETNTVEASIGVSGEPISVTLTHNGDYVYAYSRFESRIFAIETLTDTLTHTINLDTGVTQSSTSLAITSNDKLMYAAKRDSSAIAIIDIDPNSQNFHQQIGRIETNATGFREIHISSDDNFLHATPYDADQLLTIDINPTSPSYSEVVGTLQTGSTPIDFELQPLPIAQAYFSNRDDGTVSIVCNSASFTSNLPPEIVSSANEVAPLGLVYEYDVHAEDPNFDPIRYSLVQSPNGMSIDQSSGLITWLPLQDQVGLHQVIVEANDLVSGLDRQEFTITVSQSEQCGLIDTGGGPTSMSVTDDGLSLLVVDYAEQAVDTSGSVFVINTLTEELRDTIPLRTGFPQSVLTAPGDRAFVIISKAAGSVISSGYSSIEVIDLLTNSVIASIPISGHNPFGLTNMVFSSDKEKLYVTDRGNNRVYVVDTENYSVLKAIGVGAEPINLSLNQSGDFLYVYSRRSPIIYVIDTNTDSVIDTISLSLGISVGHTTLTVTPDDRFIYAGHPYDNTIGIVDTDSQSPTYRQQIGTIETEAEGIRHLITSDDGRFLYVAIKAASEILVIDLNPNADTYQQVVNSLPVGQEPKYIDLQHTAVAQAYVSNFDDGTVSVICNRAASNLHDPEIVTESIPSADTLRSYSFQIQAADQDLFDRLEFELILQPSGMTIDLKTGRLLWLPEESQLGIHDVTVRVSDEADHWDEKTFQIEVVDGVNSLPSISSVAHQYAYVDEPYNYQVFVSDSDGDSLSYSLGAQAPTSAIIDVSGLFSADLGEHNFEIIVSDPFGSVLHELTLIVNQGPSVNTPPYATSTPVEQAFYNKSYFYQVVAVDNENDSINFSLGEGAPESMLIDENTGLISWSPRGWELGVYDINVRMLDGRGMLGEHKYLLRAGLSGNSTPVIITGQMPSVFAGDLFNYTVNAVDGDNDPLAFAVHNLSRGRYILADNGK